MRVLVAVESVDGRKGIDGLAQLCGHSWWPVTGNSLASMSAQRPTPFRHSHASHLVAAGVPTVHVQNVLGHRHLSSTQIYTHVSKEQLLQAARALE